MPIRRALLVLLVLAAPACMRWEPARTPAPAAHPAGQAASVADGAAAQALGAGLTASDGQDRAAQPGIGERPAAEAAPLSAAERREAGPLTTIAIIAVVAAGALAVFLLLAHVNC